MVKGYGTVSALNLWASDVLLATFISSCNSFLSGLMKFSAFKQNRRRNLNLYSMYHHQHVQRLVEEKNRNTHSNMLICVCFLKGTLELLAVYV